MSRTPILPPDNPRAGRSFDTTPKLPRRSRGNPRAPLVQAKLKVGAPNDLYEQEADRAADRVMRMPERTVREARDSGVATSGTIQPAVRTARLESPGTAIDRIVPDPLHTKPQGSGQPLPDSTRAFLEPRFGHDFSKVRIHADPSSARSAAALGARAYTVGHDIVFGAAQYRPETTETRSLLAHELTHVIQQERGGVRDFVQTDLAVEPTTPAAPPHVLSAAEIQAAIAFNVRTITDIQEIEMLRDILGLSPAPATVDADFVQAVADYQVAYGLTPDGKIGPLTRRRLSQEILAEARSLGFTNLGGLESGVRLRTQLDGLIGAGNTNYGDFRTHIQAATVLQRDVILAEPAFLIRLRNHLTTWNDFARCVELLGRRAPTHDELVRNATVNAELAAAWTASNPAVNPPVGTQHEEGGWVYLNLITNVFTTRRQAAGAGAAIDLATPPIEADSIVVAKFHTHPNLGPAWAPGPSPQDATVDAAHGVPDIVVGSIDVDPTTFDIFASGPNRRLHLAGNQGLPGATGGLAPQAKADGSYDEQ